MTEIKLEKRFPHIPDEDVTRIFQDGYMKGWENAMKKSIPIEWIKYHIRALQISGSYTDAMLLTDLIDLWEKENDKNI
jgi:hypothetical protein